MKDQILVIQGEELEDKLTKIVQQALKKNSEENSTIDKAEKMGRKDASQFLDVSYQTMYNWTKKGILKEHGQGRKKFYLRNELIEALRK